MSHPEAETRRLVWSNRWAAIGAIGTILGIAVAIVIAAAADDDSPRPPAATTSQTSAASEDPQTDVRVLAVEATDDGLLPAEIRGFERRGEGQCESSMLSSRYDAYRCSDGGYFMDPCFKPAFGDDFFCVIDPWSVPMTGAIVRSPDAGGTDGSGNPMDADPFAIRLENGLECTFATGTSYDVAGERAHYFCSEPGTFGPDGYAVGDVDRSADVWTIRFKDARTDSGSVTAARISVAWF